MRKITDYLVFSYISVDKKNKRTKQSVMNAKIHNLSELSQYFGDKTTLCLDFFTLMKELRIGQSLSALHMNKEKGLSSIDTLQALLIFRLCGASIFKSYKDKFKGLLYEGTGKNTFYRFLKRPNMNWRLLLYKICKAFNNVVATKSIDTIKEKYLILDDTTLPKTGSKMEGIGKVFDHTTHQQVKGYKLQLLAYSDGKSCLPLDFSLHSEKGKRGNFGLTSKQLSKRFTCKRTEDDCAKLRVDELTKEKPVVAIEMIKRACKQGFRTNYVLMDKWYFGKNIIQTIIDQKMHVVTLLRDKRTKFLIDGKTLSAEHQARIIESKMHSCKKYKCRYATKYASYQGIKVKLFFVRYGKQQDWTVIVTTDTSLSFTSVFEKYQVRWNIEVVFRETKQCLKLGSCQGTSLNCQIADCTLVFIAYTLMSLKKRFSDYETLGGLFQDLRDDTIMLTLWERILPLIKELICEICISLDVEFDKLMRDMIADNEMCTKIFNFLKYYPDVKERA